MKRGPEREPLISDYCETSLEEHQTRCDLVQVKGWPKLLITVTRAKEVIHAGMWVVDEFIRTCFGIFFWLFASGHRKQVQSAVSENKQRDFGNSKKIKGTK